MTSMSSPMAPSSHQYGRIHQHPDSNYTCGDNKFISSASLAILIVFLLLLRSSAGPFLSPKVSITLNFLLHISLTYPMAQVSSSVCREKQRNQNLPSSFTLHASSTSGLDR